MQGSYTRKFGEVKLLKSKRAHVMSRLIGELVTSRPLNIFMEQKSVEENVGAHLL
jgi:hypothetical protein